jgi:predicted NBD/HSP70 family sugar kinase
MKPARVSPMDWSVLQVVQRLGAAPQHMLADQVGRQRSTVNGAVRRLLDAGWLRRAGQAVHGPGRPAILLAVNRDAGCFAGVEIAARDLHCAIVAADGTLLDQATTRLNEDVTLPAVLDQIDLQLHGLLSRLNLDIGRLLGLWSGVNGVVDEHGVVVTCASLGWHHQPLHERLGQRYGCDVIVEGASATTNAAAEALLGAGQGATDVVYYHAGRGISARLVRQGQSLAGSTRRAGELGHVVVAPGGNRCACGNRGCLEAVASGPAITAAIRRLPRRDLPEELAALLRPSADASDAEIVAAAFGQSKRKTAAALRELLQSTTHHLATGAAMAIAAYDPEVLVLGGYLFEDNVALRDGVSAALARLVLDWDDRGVRVVQSQVVIKNRAVGGAAAICQRFWANPRGVLATN